MGSVCEWLDVNVAFKYLRFIIEEGSDLNPRGSRGQKQDNQISIMGSIAQIRKRVFIVIVIMN